MPKPFQYESLSYEEALQRCDAVPPPRSAEVRWVASPVAIDGDFSLDEERSTTPPETLWESASAGPLILSPVVAETSAAPSQALDPTFAAAQSLLEHWSRAQKVVLFDGVDQEAFANELALVLESLGDRFDVAAALGQWLMDRDEVDDVLVDDAALLKLDES